MITSPLRGEVARNARVGVIYWVRRQVTPPRSFAPTLPLKGRVTGPMPPRSTESKGTNP
jgi:hypothetical protein